MVRNVRRYRFTNKSIGADFYKIIINYQKIALLEQVSRSGNLPTIKTEDSRQTGTESRVTGRENQVPPAIRRWVPPSLRPQHGLTEADKNDAIFRKVRGILNKLTPEKFQKLSDDLLQLDLGSSKILKGIIHLIFEKALDEPKYSSMYAQLCKRLSKEAPNFNQPESCCTFLVLLLSVCRDKFENRSNYSENNLNTDSPLTSDDEEKQHVAKQKVLGNIKFIGELFKLDMLAEVHLHKMLQQLLDKNGRSYSSLQSRCEDMECLAELTKTCGKDLDSEQGKGLMNQYFEKLERKSHSNKYPPRIRFLIRDVIELRRNNWKPRKVARTEGPVPIQELNNDVDDIIRPSYINRNRDYRNNQDRDSNHWMLYSSLNLNQYNDMFSMGLSLTNSSPLIPPYGQNSYNNRDHREGGGGGVGGYRMHNNQRNNQHNNFNNNINSNNNNNMRYNKNNNNNNNNSNNLNNMHNNHHHNNHAHNNMNNNVNNQHHHHNNNNMNNINVHNYSNNNNNNNNNNNSNMINNKDVAPRFKRNIVPPTTAGSMGSQQQSGNNMNNIGGTNGDHLNELQMRPTPNSLLYKYNMNLKSQTQLPLQPPQTLNNNAKNNSYNNHRTNDYMSSNSGAQINNSSYITPPSTGMSMQQKQDLNVKSHSTGLAMNTIPNKPQLITAQAATPINNILQKDQIPIKQISAEKLNKQNKNKDKGPNKNDFLKKITEFINETLVLKDHKTSTSPTNAAAVPQKPTETPAPTTAVAEENNKTAEVAGNENEVVAIPADPPIESVSAEVKVEEPMKEVLPVAEGEANHDESTSITTNTDTDVPVIAENPVTAATEPAVENGVDAAHLSENKTQETVTTDEVEDEDKEKNIDEIAQIFDDLKVPDKFFKDSIIKIINEMLDKNDINQIIQVTEFLMALRNRNRLTNNQLLDAFKTIINSINEKEKTIPKITTHIATLLSRSIIIKLCKLNDIAKITENGQFYPLFLLVLQQLHKIMGKEKLQETFNSSKINLMLNLPECDRTKDRMAEILEDRNLSFLYPLLRVQAELWKQIQTDPNPQQFYKWIKENVDSQCFSDSGFITAMMTVLLKYITLESTLPEGSDANSKPDAQSVEKEKDLLEKFSPVLNAFLNGNIDLQLIAIYALQVYCFSVGFPKGMLLRWFKELYESSVIEEDAYLRWREDITDMYPGKGDALFEVNKWLTWLQDAESEEEEDEE